jgi:hypothetical protein
MRSERLDSGAYRVGWQVHVSFGVAFWNALLCRLRGGSSGGTTGATETSPATRPTSKTFGIPRPIRAHFLVESGPTRGYEKCRGFPRPPMLTCLPWRPSWPSSTLGSGNGCGNGGSTHRRQHWPDHAEARNGRYHWPHHAGDGDGWHHWPDHAGYGYGWDYPCCHTGEPCVICTNGARFARKASTPSVQWNNARASYNKRRPSSSSSVW